MDKYEKLYNEALERFKSFKEKYYTKDTNLGDVIFDKNGEMQKDFNGIFPELVESEDERIRKGIVETIKQCPDTFLNPKNRDAMLVWLEKQKEATCFAELMNKLTATEQEVMFNAWPKEEKETHYTKRNALFDKCVAECDPEIMQRVSDEIDEMLGKEQKPNSTEDMPYITDEHFYEREPVDSFKYKLAEYMTKNCTKKEGPYGYEYGISAETILKMAEEELLKRGVVQKPVKWSEEDKNGMFSDIIMAIRAFYKCEREDLVDYVKSLNPIKKEWSENDNIGWDEAFACVTRAEKAAKNEEELQNAVTAEKWLKEIKFKYYVHPVKQEWNEEDEKMRNLIVAIFEINHPNGFFKANELGTTDMRGVHTEEIISWLKSLRPSWKPSEEQMNALNFAITYFMHETSYKNPTELRDLYEDLLKLKGGVAPMRDIDE